MAPKRTWIPIETVKKIKCTNTLMTAVRIKITHALILLHTPH